jgi:UDP-2,4-diacetamido-2,4,6-trideoxy-beta-L-altropyranose hydrolase
MAEATTTGAGAGPVLLIRADASPQMGTGHLMRCLALAQAWQEIGGSTLVASASLTPALEARLAAEGIAVRHLSAEPGSAEDAARAAALAQEVGAGWLVLDGYQFGGEYQRALAQAGLRQLCVDDYGHAGHYWAHVVLNQNAYAVDSLYPSREAYARLLLGTDHALLRREFWPWRSWKREVSAVAHRVLVTLGGADAGNATLKVLEALDQAVLPELEVKVVVGGSCPHLDTLRGAAQAAGLHMCLLENVTTMPELMAWADIAVTGAGATSWELAFMQLPSLVLVLAENQRQNAEWLAGSGAAVNLGWHTDVTASDLADALRTLILDEGSREAMILRTEALVDGRGSQRVVELLHQAVVRARCATESDSELLFVWANDPLTRRMSFHSEPIPWEDHQRWFGHVLEDPHVLLIVVETWEAGSWVPVGQVRIDRNGTTSIALALAHRGRRLGPPALQVSVALARARTPGRQLVAYIKPENQASQRVFSQTGFRKMGLVEVLQQPCLRYLYG